MTIHTPVEEGECLACHLPHFSDVGELLKDKAPALCGDCHDIGDKDLVAKHGGIGMDGVNCTGCHTPHLAKAKGLIWAEQHSPFADRGCDECHE
jgi:predicted CXXCH cytochrome family protein